MNAFNALSRCPICRTNRSRPEGCCTACYQALFTPSAAPQIVTLGTYGGRLEQAIRAYKFHGATRLSRLFSAQLAKNILSNRWQVDAICAVPLHRFRFLQRGYNQAAVLAKALSRELEVPYIPALTRTRRTRQQARLSRAERAENVASAFRLSVTPEKIRGKHLILVDDVITSGATVAACQEVLISAGAKSVKLAAVARARLSEG